MTAYRVTLAALILAYSAASANTGCSAAQVKKIETGIPVDMATIGCVISVAVTDGLSLGLVAAQCGTDLATAAQVLYEAVLLPPDAGYVAEAKRAPLLEKPAVKDAMSWKAMNK